MRYLRKITFINSAHIRYAEVAMDGNVHFTGTQGVGKTTLLRALLFFYNCRKDRLGIRTQGQQTFDDFYVPTPSSYIVYEVSRGDDEPSFSIILFRHHNRAAFRFADAPYSREWFIDEVGIVTSDHATLRQRIHDCGIDLSSIIDRYTQYLDILYGNINASLPKDLRKYYLLKSRQYQNIPRIIQNVFLNERVDAGFIKDIIINSIASEDEEIAVDLNFFRSKLTHFSDELKDISLWSERNRQGIVETRRDADRIIGISHDIKAAIFSLREQCGMLNYAMQKAERDIPILQSRIGKTTEAIRQLDEKIKGLEAKHNQEKDKVSGRIAVLTRDLKRASELKKMYQETGIDYMIARAGKQAALRLELEQKEQLLRQLTSSHESISDKYKMLRDRISLNRQIYLQTLHEKRNKAESEHNIRQSERMKRKSKIETEIRDKCKAEIAEIDKRLDACREMLFDQKVQREKAAASSPMQQELTACRENIAEAETKIHQLTEQKLKEENRLDAIRNKFELDCRQIETDTIIQIRDLEARISQLESNREEELRLLDRSQGSLCEWLDSNMEGWENTIGKIADEKDVLYSQNLSPRVADGRSDTLYGVSIDLSAIDKEVRTPAMIREAISKLDKEIQSLANSIIKLREDKESRISAAQKEIRSQQKSIQSDIDTIGTKIQVSRQQAKQESLRLDSIKEEERKHIEAIKASFDERIRDLQLQADNIAKEHHAADTRCINELRRATKAIADEEKSDVSQRDDELASISNDIVAYTQRHETAMRQLDNDEARELADSGADALMIVSVKKEITEIKRDLERIDSEREKIAEYRKDCRELLDNVTRMQLDKKKLEDEAAALQEKYDKRRSKYELKKQEEERNLSGLTASCTRCVESRQKADEFTATNACPPEFKESASIATNLDCITIIDSIKSLDIDIHRLSDKLKESTNEFRKRFSQNNTFKFPTSFDTINDYHLYADSLEDFVSNDKIKDFQQVTSNLYRDILSRAASDFNILLGHESEILRIIRDINYDFEKKTFAGVIRRIELRLDRSTTPVITQLHNITDFWNSHQFDLGEVNLFTSDKHSDINRESIKYLKSLSSALNYSAGLNKLTLDQTFALKFRITENDNTTDWVENIRAVGSEGTDILVKAIINILLISVFKKRAGQAGDFRLHCMMDEIGRLADENISGILNFANQRGIFIVNSSPKAHRPLSYRRLYMLSKDQETNTIVQPILSIREAEMQ